MPVPFTDVPPVLVLLAVAGLGLVVVACRAIVACMLGLAAIRATRSRDLSEALRAVRDVIDTLYWWRR